MLPNFRDLSKKSCVSEWGNVDMECVGRGKGVTQLQEHSLGSGGVAHVESPLRSTLAGIRACHESSALASRPGKRAGLRVELKLKANGAVDEVSEETEGIDDPSLTDCIVALFKQLKFEKPSRPGAHVKYTVSFTTLFAARSLDEQVEQLCTVSQKMLADPSWNRATVLQETALRFTEAQPSKQVLDVMNGLATTPRGELYAAWTAGLRKLGAKQPECPALKTLWEPSKAP